MPHSQSNNGLSRAAPKGAATSCLSCRVLIDIYINIMDRLAMVAAIVAALLLCSGVLSVCHMIVVRSMLGHSATWQTEYTTYSITGAMLLGSPYVLLTGGHIAVTVLLEVVNDAVRNVMQLLASLIGFAFCAALAYASWHHLIEAWQRGWGTGTVWDPPLWMAIAPIAVGATLLAMQYVAELLRKPAIDGGEE